MKASIVQSLIKATLEDLKYYLSTTHPAATGCDFASCSWVWEKHMF